MGNVSFYDGTNVIDTVALRRGRAGLRVSNLPTGRDLIHADYGGAEDFFPSISATVVVTVRARRTHASVATPADVVRRPTMNIRKTAPGRFAQALALSPWLSSSLMQGPTFLGVIALDQDRSPVTIEPSERVRHSQSQRFMLAREVVGKSENNHP
jgi:hypothetical protein